MRKLLRASPVAAQHQYAHMDMCVCGWREAWTCTVGILAPCRSLFARQLLLVFGRQSCASAGQSEGGTGRRRALPLARVDCRGASRCELLLPMVWGRAGSCAGRRGRRHAAVPVTLSLRLCMAADGITYIVMSTARRQSPPHALGSAGAGVVGAGVGVGVVLWRAWPCRGAEAKPSVRASCEWLACGVLL